MQQTGLPDREPNMIAFTTLTLRYADYDDTLLDIRVDDHNSPKGME